MSKQTVVFDFDGVIHSYTSGWKGVDVVSDPPVPGIKESIDEIRNAGYEVAVVSTRCASKEGLNAVETYLADNEIEVDKVCKEKPPAIVYIDDRALCFDGKPHTLLDKIKNFEPWNKQTALPNNEKANYYRPEVSLPHIPEIDNSGGDWDAYLPFEDEILYDVPEHQWYIGDGNHSILELMPVQASNNRGVLCPCNVGDVVFIVDEKCVKTDTVSRIWNEGNGFIATMTNSNYEYNLTEDYGKVIFHDLILASWIDKKRK